MDAESSPRITLPPVTLRQAEALVGLAYVPGTFDCAHLAVLAQEYLFGRQVRLPNTGLHPQGARGQAAAIRRHCDQLATHVEEPQTGDVVLFIEEVEGGVRWHIGTVILELGQRWVLHTTQAQGASVLQRMDDCLRAGLWVEGFYRWR